MFSCVKFSYGLLTAFLAYTHTHNTTRVITSICLSLIEIEVTKTSRAMDRTRMAARLGVRLAKTALLLVRACSKTTCLAVHITRHFVSRMGCRHPCPQSPPLAVRKLQTQLQPCMIVYGITPMKNAIIAVCVYLPRLFESPFATACFLSIRRCSCC